MKKVLDVKVSEFKLGMQSLSCSFYRKVERFVRVHVFFSGKVYTTTEAIKVTYHPFTFFASYLHSIVKEEHKPVIYFRGSHKMTSLDAVFFI